MTSDEIENMKEEIDEMSRLEMAHLWRYASAGHPYFNKELPLYDHFKARFDSLGGFSPEISKAIS